MDKRKLVFGGICMVSVIVAIVLLGVSSAAEPQYGGILKISRSAESRGLGYPPTVKHGEIYVGWPCVQTLLKLDNRGLPTPNLVESWDVDSAKNSLLLHLKKGVKFHDMTDFNAAAVQYNLTEIYKNSDLMADVESVSVVDDYTVLLKLKSWSNVILVNMCLKSGLIISPKAYKEHGKDWCQANPVGTGPFKFVSWERDVMVKFEKFKHYWEKGKPYLDGIEYHIIADPMTQLGAFKKGEQHIAADIAPKDAHELKASGRHKLSSISGQYHAISGDGINPDSVWANLKVRQAMMYAIDRKSIAEAVGYGFWTVTPRNQLALPGGWADNPDVEGYPYDPKKARQLLIEAGYPNGFKTTILSINQPQHVVEFMTAIQGQLREIGIDGNLDLMDPGREFKVNVGGGWKDGVLWVPHTFRSELAIYTGVYVPGQDFHKSTARPAEFQEAIKDATEAVDFKTMQKLMHKVQKLAVDKYAVTDFLFVLPYIAAKYPQVHDDGFMEVSNTNWHPENAWLSK